MIYRVTNKRRSPIQLALRTRDGGGTHVITLPWKATFDIPEEKFSEQITALENNGDVLVEKIYKVK